MRVKRKARARTRAINRRGDLMKKIDNTFTNPSWDSQLKDRMDAPPAARGGRNDEMWKLATDIVWAGKLTESELFDFFRSRYDSDVKDYEIRYVIRWAYDVTTPRSKALDSNSFEYRKSKPSKSV